MEALKADLADGASLEPVLLLHKDAVEMVRAESRVFNDHSATESLFRFLHARAPETGAEAVLTPIYSLYLEQRCERTRTGIVFDDFRTVDRGRSESVVVDGRMQMFSPTSARC